MARFVVVCPDRDNADRILELARKEGFNTLEASPTTLLVESDELSQRLAEKLSVQQGGNTAAIIKLNSASAGYYNKAVWEWLDSE